MQNGMTVVQGLATSPDENRRETESVAGNQQGNNEKQRDTGVITEAWKNTKNVTYDQSAKDGNLQSLKPAEDRNRSSLDDLESWPQSRTWQHPVLPQATGTPLPPSRASSIIPTGSQADIEQAAVQSLEQLTLLPENIPLPKRITRKRAVGKSSADPIAQPGAGTSSKSKKRSKKVTPSPQPPPQPELVAYRTDVNVLAGHFSDLKNIAASQTRHQWSSRIVFYDHFGPTQTDRPRRQEPWKSRISAPLYEEFYSTLRNVSDECIQRIIFVEDLTPTLIDLLGATFQIPPHVFEEHLDRSGYRSSLEPRETKSTWHTRSSTQGYSSVTWYRPVLPLVPMTAKFRARLILDRKPVVPCVFDGCRRLDGYWRHNLRLTALANIWRHQLELCPEAGLHHRGSETEYPVGWEERVTIWTRDFGNCRFVVLFLDPLPVVVDETTATRPRNLRQQRPTLANLWIRRQEQVTKVRPSKAQPNIRATEVHDWIPRPPSPQLPESQPARRSSPVADFEAPSPLPPASKISEAPGETQLSSQSVTGGPISAGAVPSSDPPINSGVEVPPPPPPPPFIGRGQLSIDRDQSRTTSVQIEPQEATIPLAALRRRATRTDMERASILSGGEDNRTQEDRRRRPSFAGRKGVPSAPISSRMPASQPLVSDDGSLSVDNHGPFVPYHPIRTRLSASARYGDTFTALRMRAYIESRQVPTSTLEEFDYFLQLPTKGKEQGQDPLRALMRAIHDDTLGLVDVIRVSLRQIREGTLDEDLMQRNVTFWRSLLYQMNFSLAEFDQRLQEFVHFVYESETRPLTSDSRADLPSEKLAKATRRSLSSCMDLIDRASDSLRAEMQIVDSRRSIAEAESVSKLTELAFVFIPLSFVASLFSMQVHELDGGVPLYQFVLVAIAFVIVAYAVRLSIRSSRLIEYKNNALNEIREKAELQYNDPIPAHTFIAWFGTTTSSALIRLTKNSVVIFAPLIFVLAIIAAILSPIVLLWMRGINKGFTGVITALLLLLDILLVYPVVTNSAGELEFNLKARLYEIQRNREKNRKKRKKAKRRLKRKAGLDPEALGLEDSDSSDDEQQQRSESEA